MEKYHHCVLSCWGFFLIQREPTVRPLSSPPAVRFSEGVSHSTIPQTSREDVKRVL